MNPTVGRLLLRGRIRKVSDTFTRADSITTLGMTETGQTWQGFGGGVWGISNGRAYTVSGITGTTQYISLEITKYIVSAVLRGILQTTGASYPSIVFHQLDNNNYLFVHLYNDKLRLSKKDLNVVTELANVAMTTSDNTDYLVEIVCNGCIFKISVNGNPVLAYTLSGADTKFSQYINAGMRNNGANGAAGAKWDNFKVEV